MRRRFERFCFMHRDKGIPNLMLYVVIGCALVSLTAMIGYGEIYDLLIFDRAAILRGQVWRLFSWVFTTASGNPRQAFLVVILLYCYWSLGRAVESFWGTLRFNLFYLSGILLMDIFAMALGGIDAPYSMGGITVYADGYYLYAGSMSNYLHLSLLISYATLNRDARFLVFFVIPIKAWILALIYLGLTVFEVIALSVPTMYFPHNLFPLVALGNYFLFFGKDVLLLLPDSWRIRKKQPVQTKKPDAPISFDRSVPHKEKAKPAYIHRCAICGRTDVSDPGLEFRYCSRCNGYFCYCEDHISNHTHIQ